METDTGLREDTPNIRGYLSLLELFHSVSALSVIALLLEENLSQINPPKGTQRAIYYDVIILVFFSLQVFVTLLSTLNCWCPCFLTRFHWPTKKFARAKNIIAILTIFPCAITLIDDIFIRTPKVYVMAMFLDVFLFVSALWITYLTLFLWRGINSEFYLDTGDTFQTEASALYTETLTASEGTNTSSDDTKGILSSVLPTLLGSEIFFAGLNLILTIAFLLDNLEIRSFKSPDDKLNISISIDRVLLCLFLIQIFCSIYEFYRATADFDQKKFTFLRHFQSFKISLETLVLILSITMLVIDRNGRKSVDFGDEHFGVVVVAGIVLVFGCFFNVVNGIILWLTYNDLLPIPSSFSLCSDSGSPLLKRDRFESAD